MRVRARRGRPQPERPRDRETRGEGRIVEGAGMKGLVEANLPRPGTGTWRRGMRAKQGGLGPGNGRRAGLRARGRVRVR